LAPEFNLREEIKKRDLNIFHVFIASLLGQLAERGTLNIGFLNMILRSIGEKIAEYLTVVIGPFSKMGDIKENIKKSIEEIVSYLDPFKEYSLGFVQNGLIIQINADTCKFCPKRVGGAELPRSLCPFPVLIGEIISNRIKLKLEPIIPGVRRRKINEKTYCVFGYRIGEIKEES